MCDLTAVYISRAYYTRVGSTSQASDLALLRIELQYYRHDNIADALHDSFKQETAQDASSLAVRLQDAEKLVEKLHAKAEETKAEEEAKAEEAAAKAAAKAAGEDVDDDDDDDEDGEDGEDGGEEDADGKGGTATIVVRAKTWQEWEAESQAAAERASVLAAEATVMRKSAEAAAASESAVTSVLVGELARIVYAHSQPRSKARALLCHVYSYALHGEFLKARDLLLMSHLQESIQLADVETQVLFNRTMAQLGICSLRAGRIEEAHGCLTELCAPGRTRELLAQGLLRTRFSEKSEEEQAIERRRILPYHMHINLELLECCHLTAAMLLEVPNMAAAALDVKRRVISRHFRYKYRDYFLRSVCTGPPEQSREFVLTAARHVLDGDWQKATQLLTELPIWKLLPQPEDVKTVLRARVPEVTLRTYLFSYSGQYRALTLTRLADMFSMPQSRVHSLVSSMIISGELRASFESADVLVMHETDSSSLHAMSLRLADKLSALVDSNERLLARAGGSAVEDKSSGKKHHGRGRRDGRDDRRRDRRSAGSSSSSRRGRSDDGWRPGGSKEDTVRKAWSGEQVRRY
eukprot:PLAT12492.1.p2 GENE.PLAT12492.1~~PLAT12492.1.p2  ORF type:complete len:580 (+),score=367.45 PLAT12492.1:1785-3524(+)